MDSLNFQDCISSLQNVINFDLMSLAIELNQEKDGTQRNKEESEDRTRNRQQKNDEDQFQTDKKIYEDDLSFIF